MTSEAENWLLTIRCSDRAGIVAGVSGAIAAFGGSIVEAAQFGDELSGTFFMRVHYRAKASEDDQRASLSEVGGRFDMEWVLVGQGARPRVAVMVSKASHCLVNLLHAWHDQDLPVEVCGVVSNHRELEKMAAWYEVPFVHIPISRDTKGDSEAALEAVLKDWRVDLVVLARYMQIMSEGFCERWSSRVINIHHSFLPSFKGARPYHQAHARGVKLIGATAHYATSDLDEGPIIEQAVERVGHDDDPTKLVRLGQELESRVLNRAVRYHAESRILLNGHRTVVFD